MAAAFATAVILVGLSAPAVAGPTPSGPNEHLVISLTSGSAARFTDHVTATGVVSGSGTITTGQGNVFPAIVTLPQGELRFKVSIGPGHDTLNPASCTDAVIRTDTIKVTGGTGVFAGATGSGSDKVYAASIFAKNGDGTCNFDAPIKVGITVLASLHLHLV